jgi:hypothetical protein
MDNAPPALQGAKSAAKNLKKSLSEFEILEG